MQLPTASEQQVFQMLKEEKVQVPMAVWGAIFYHIGGYVAYIHQVTSYFIGRNEPIPVAQGKQILVQAMRVRDVMQNIFYPPQAMYQTNSPIHYLVREILMHHVANKAHTINMCVGYYINPVEEGPVPVDDAQKVLVCAESIRAMLDRLCRATTPTATG